MKISILLVTCIIVYAEGYIYRPHMGPPVNPYARPLPNPYIPQRANPLMYPSPHMHPSHPGMHQTHPGMHPSHHGMHPSHHGMHPNAQWNPAMQGMQGMNRKPGVNIIGSTIVHIKTDDDSEEHDDYEDNSDNSDNSPSDSIISFAKGRNAVATKTISIRPETMEQILNALNNYQSKSQVNN